MAITERFQIASQQAATGGRKLILEERRLGWRASEAYEKKDEPPKESKPAFVPRQHLKKEQDSIYKDRAALRREGVNDEFKSVEKLLEDFEARKEHATAEELAEIEKQRVYLGGDAEHSVLVKGLDYALLAARRAELAREQGEEMDDELEAFQEQMKDKKPAKSKAGKGKEEEKPQEEGLGKGFKSIAQKQAEAEAAAAAPGDKKKKKKKKKVKTDPASAPIPDTTATPSSIPSKGATVEEPIKPPPKTPTPPPPESDDDDDIFGDAGEYDLAAAAGPVGSDSDSEDEKMDAEEVMEGAWVRDLRGVDIPGLVRDLESAAATGPGQARETTKDDTLAPLHTTDTIAGGRHRHQGAGTVPPPTRARVARMEEITKDAGCRTAGRRRGGGMTRGRGPREDATLHLLVLVVGRTLTPAHLLLHLAELALPLASSAIPSLKSFLAADEADAKADEKRANKAKWRAYQGMSMQEGAEEDTAAAKQKTMNEKQKSNREYQLLMNKMKKDEEREGKEGKK
ncbi:hypothetical protein B9479_004144 [Cryptococcus floricola]|uniref:RED-like N-terminal domain-containing protein n=1 Tax=Cryptococcus floricola TaxID=2591691 RepID=A0A5D3AYM9_9TREE|nr:hypothetical protein B9479_004144 [Cryptococcus floricola]